MFVVNMSSDVYGSEDFRYETEGEALDGLRRLAKSGLDKRDGVERIFTIRRGRMGGDEGGDA